MQACAIAVVSRFRVYLSLVIAVAFGVAYPFLDLSLHRYKSAFGQHSVIDRYPSGGAAVWVTLPGHLPQGTEWSQGTTIRQGEVLEVHFSNPQTATRVRVQTDGNDDYRLGVTSIQDTTYWFEIPDQQKSGLTDRIIKLPGQLIVKKIVVYPMGGDAAFSVSAVELADGLTSGVRLAGVVSWIAAFMAACALLFLAAASGSWILSRLLSRDSPARASRQTQLFTQALGAVYFLAGCALAGFSLYNLFNQPELNSCSPSWYLAALGAVACLWSAARIVDNTDTKVEGAAQGRSGTALWAGMCVFRALPFVAGLIPLGLFWEENQAAVGGRASLIGECGYLLLYTFNELGIGLAFILFGVSEYTVHLWAALLGVLSCLLFERTTSLLFRRTISLFLALLFATSLSMTVVSFIAEESFAMTIFCMTGVLWGLVSCLKTQRLASFVGLGAFLGLAAMEYAALKPGIVIAPLVLLSGFVLRWRTTSFSLLALVQAASRGGAMSLAAVILAAPIILNALDAGTAFFEGARAEQMVGATAQSFLLSRLPEMLPSLQDHLRQFLWQGAESPPLVGFGRLAPGLLSVGESILFLLSALAAPLLFVRAFFVARSSAVAIGCRMALWLGWLALLVWYCALFNNDVTMSRRLLVCVPLVFLFVGEVLQLASAVFSVPQRVGRFVTIAGVLAVVSINSVLLWKTLTSPAARAEYSGKTNNLCAYLNNAPASDSYAIGYYWPARGTFFFGDTTLESWRESMTEVSYTSYEKYGNWACIVDHPVPLVRPLAHGAARILSETAAARRVSHVILMERARNLTETNPVGRISTDMFDRLRNEVARMSSQVDTSRCTYIADSSWFLSVVCPLK